MVAKNKIWNKVRGDYIKVDVKYGSIVDFEMDVDVMVNAWNQNIFHHRLLICHGVSGAIKKKSGLCHLMKFQRGD